MAGDAEGIPNHSPLYHVSRGGRVGSFIFKNKTGFAFYFSWWTCVVKHWYALRSKPKREQSAATLLEKAGLEVFLPLIYQKKIGRLLEPEPFFPGYFFSRLDPTVGEIRLAQYTRGVLYVVGFGGEPCTVPDNVILALKERLVKVQGSNNLTEFRPGDRVTMSAGPFREMEAIFNKHLSATGRVQVLVQMLQRLCRVEVKVGQLRLVGESAAAFRA